MANFFIDPESFKINAEKRNAEMSILKWEEMDQTRIYMVDKIEKMTSKYPDKLSGVLHCHSKDGIKKKVFAPHSLLEEIYRHSEQTAYFQCLGSLVTEKGKKHQFNLDFV